MAGFNVSVCYHITCQAYIKLLESAGVKISMDGKGVAENIQRLQFAFDGGHY